MKKAILFIFFSVITTCLYSQDLILTKQGDSLNCRITDIRGGFIYFTFQQDETLRSTVLPKSEVKLHQKNFYYAGRAPLSSYSPKKEDYPRLRAALHGGLSYRTARVSDDIPPVLKEYTKDLKSGYSLGGDLIYYFSEPLGLGFKINMHKSSAEMDGVSITDPQGNTYRGKIKDDISIFFLGPVVGTRLLNGTKENAFIVNLALGYLGYKDDAFLMEPFTLSGSTVGLAWDLGYDFKFSGGTSLGFQVSLFTGALTKLEMDNGRTTQTIKLEKENYENLSWIDLSVGLRFK